MPRVYIKKRNKTYDDNTLELAIEAIQNGCSIREASNTFNIPYTTLNSHSNSVVLYDKIGRPSKFTKEEEICLEQAALALQSWGAPLTKAEFINLAKQYASTLKKSHLFPSQTPTPDWFRSFLKRHENLILKKSRPMEKKRAKLTIEQVNKWFDLLSKIIQENDLANRPGSIFNCDETGMSDSISYSKVLVHRQTSNAYRIQGGTGGKSYISVMFCASAAGLLLPPFVIYKSKRIFQEWCLGGPPNTCFSNSDNGWIDQNLFYQWFEQVFVQQTKDLSRPLLLIIDGYSSHFSVETLRLAMQNDIIIACLPSNATHLLQPLDVVFFNPLKIEWKKILKDEYLATKFKNIDKTRFPHLLNQLFQTEAIKNKNNIIKSFMRAGVFPLNPKSIDHSRILQNNRFVSNSSSLTNDTSNDDSVNNLFSTTDSISLNDNHHNTDDSSTDKDTDGSTHTTNINTFSSIDHTVASFASSQEAIATLDRVLQESAIIDIDNSDDNSDEDNDDDDDEDYVPTRSSSNLSKNVTSAKKQISKSKNIRRSKTHQSTSSRKSKKGKKVTFDLSDSDFTDEEEDTETNPSQSFQSKKSSLTKNSQYGLSNQTNQRNQRSSMISSIDLSNESDATTRKQSSTNLEHSLKAITDTLQTVFGSVSEQSQEQAKKRTVVKRLGGRIVTTEDVINQMEEAKKKKTSKRPRSSSEQSNATKRRKKQESDSSVESSIRSTISIEPSNQSIVPQQLSTFANTSSPTIQQNALQQVNQLPPNVNQPSQYPLSSTNYLSNNNSENSSINSLFSSVPGALQSNIICSQCRVIVTIPTICRTCHRTFCIICINQGKYNSCLFCVVRFSSSM